MTFTEIIFETIQIKGMLRCFQLFGIKIHEKQTIANREYIRCMSMLHSGNNFLPLKFLCGM